MIYKPIRLNDGTIYMCPYKMESASEGVGFQDKIIGELSDKLDKALGALQVAEILEEG